MAQISIDQEYRPSSRSSPPETCRIRDEYGWPAGGRAEMQMEPEKVHLTGAKQTLLITLHAKAVESRSPDSLLKDRFADQALARLDYDFKPLDLGPDGAISMAMRAKAFDDWTRAFIEKHPNAIVLHLGCGLDSRVFRVEPPPEISWFDVDFPEVIDIRKRVYPAREGDYHMISASVTDPAWLEQVPGDRPAMIVAEGLMPYLPSDEAPKMLARLVAHFPSGELAFDAYGRFGLKMLRITPQVRATGAEVHCALDDPHALEREVPGLRLVNEKVRNDPAHIARMSWPARLMVKLYRHIPALRGIGRLLRYRF
jgi:O-methyltransferase involved in polyketide biosynthesis